MHRFRFNYHIVIFRGISPGDLYHLPSIGSIDWISTSRLHGVLSTLPIILLFLEESSPFKQRLSKLGVLSITHDIGHLFLLCSHENIF